ncbi:MAG: hypothetical protein GY938_07740 [Ketobacter sp.]|nr:hypothetical protein [Ketobacter sp.]
MDRSDIHDWVLRNRSSSFVGILDINGGVFDIITHINNIDVSALHLQADSSLARFSQIQFIVPAPEITVGFSLEGRVFYPLINLSAVVVVEEVAGGAGDAFVVRAGVNSKNLAISALHTISVIIVLGAISDLIGRVKGARTDFSKTGEEMEIVGVTDEVVLIIDIDGADFARGASGSVFTFKVIVVGDLVVAGVTLLSH